MKSRVLNILKYLLFVGLAASLFYWVYKDQDFDELLRVIASADPVWIAASVVFSWVSHYFRALRWQIALQPSGWNIPSGKGFLAVMIGYLANLIVPRLGEAVRCGTAKNITNVPFRYSFGAVIGERAVDLVFLISLIGFTVLVEFDRIGNFLVDKLAFTQEKMVYLFLIIAVAGLLGAGILVLIYRSRHRLAAFPFYHKLAEFLIGLKEGFTSVLKLNRRQLVGYVLLSVGIWVLYYYMTYVLFFSLPETNNLSMLCGLTVLVMGGIGLVIPTPGGVGSYHLFVSYTLVSYGLTETVGKSFAFLMHSTQTLSIIVVGVLSFLITLSMAKFKPSDLLAPEEKSQT